MSLENLVLPKKQIVFDSCLKCPVIHECNEWGALSAKQKIALTLGVGITVGVLKTCKLDNYREKL